MGFSVANFMLDYYEGFGNLPDFVTSEIDDLTQIADADLTIDSKVDDNKYGSSCVNYYDDYQVWCYVSVCDEDGCMWDRVDECLLPGEAGVEYPERCYMEPGPVCDLKGMCDDSRYDLKPEPNPDGNVCYHSFDCEDDGWDYSSDTDEPDPSDRSGNTCYYNPGCDEDDGWVYQSSQSKPSNTVGNTCRYNFNCQHDGWSYDSDTDRPSPNPDGNTCYYDINCGNNGWDYLTHDKPDTNNVINGDCHYDIACDEDEGWDYQSVDDEGDKPDCDDDEDAECTDSGWECN